MNNTCICCDTIIPEGRQVCPSCEDALKSIKVRRTKPKRRCSISSPFIQLTIDDMENNQ